jgi:hypothetical protein
LVEPVNGQNNYLKPQKILVTLSAVGQCWSITGLILADGGQNEIQASLLRQAEPVRVSGVEE